MLWTGAAIADEKDSFTADRHKERNIKCVSCHGEEEPKTAASEKACITCHKSLEAVAERTKDFTPNPHSNHITETSDVECTQCHFGHKADSPVCLNCHQGLTFQKKQEENK
jgi:fumarate reductase flavoprotein subunit